MNGNGKDKRYVLLWVLFTLYLCVTVSWKAYAFFAIWDDSSGNTHVQGGSDHIKLQGNKARENFVALCMGLSTDNLSNSTYETLPADAELEGWQ